MGVLLSLIAALCYGTSDFAAGVGGRRGDSGAVAVIAQPIALIAAVIAIAIAPAAPTASALWWGAVAGVGSGVGTLALYRGLAVARMSVVAPLSGVLTAALPALAGALSGETLSPLTWVGVGIAVPGALLVSLQPASVSADAAGPGGGIAATVATGAVSLPRRTAPVPRSNGVGYGIVAGVGFAVLFIGLARAGTRSGAWPLVPSQLVSIVVIVAVVALGRRAPAAAWRQSMWPSIVSGALGGIASLAYLAATGFGQLAVVAVITALYPAATVLLARIVEHERWGRLQLVGLACAAAAVVLTALG